MVHLKSSRRRLVGLIVLCSSLVVACADDTEENPAAGGASGSSGSSGAAGSGATGGSSGSSGASGSAGSSGTAGSAGSGGSAGSSGSGGTAGVGGSAGTAGSGGSAGSAGSGGTGGAAGCLDPSAYAAWITVADAFPFCVTEVHTIGATVGSSFYAGFSWGRHNGPMALTGTDSSATLHRFQLGASPTDPSVEQTTTLSGITPVATPVYWGSVVEIGDGTLASYSTGDASAKGEVLYTDTAFANVTSRANVNGYFSGAVVPTASSNRLLFTALSPLGAPASTPAAAGLYPFDVCSGSVSVSPSCPAGAEITSWSSYAGSVITDASHNVFAAMSGSVGGTSSRQYIRGFAAASLAGTLASPGPEGDSIVDVDGYGIGMAVVAPAAETSGWLVAVTGDSSSFLANPAVAVPFDINAGVISPGTPVPASIAPVTSGTSFTVFDDGAGNVWVAIDGPSSGDPSGAFVKLSAK